MAYIPMDWESSPQQLKYSVNIAPPGAPPYFVATSNQVEIQEAQALAYLTPAYTTPSVAAFMPTDFGRELTIQPPEPSAMAVDQFSLARPLSFAKGPKGSPSYFSPAYVAQSAVGDVIRDSLCGNLTGYARALCMLGGAVADVALPGGGGGSSPTQTLAACPTGYVPCGIAENCRCKLDSVLAQALPGDIGRQDQYGAAVMGAWGRAALTPLQRTMTTLLCPRGTVLGQDNLCYQKGSIPKSARKWNPGTKPLLTGGDVNTLRRAKGLQKKVHRLSVKFSPPRRSCAPKKRRK